MTQEDVLQLFFNLDLDRYDEEDCYDWIKYPYVQGVNRTYKTDEGEFVVWGQLCASQFDAEGFDFESKDGEAFSIDLNHYYKEKRA